MLDLTHKVSISNQSTARYALRILKKPVLGRICFVAILLLIWEFVTHAGWISPLILAVPSRSLLRLCEELLGGELAKALLLTAYEISVGFLISALLGLTIGYLFWRFETLGRACEPFLGATFSTPTVLLYPICLVIFGRTEWVPIVMGIIIGVVPVIINTQAGLSNIKSIYIKRGRSLGMNSSQVFNKILMPAAAPVIFSGLKLCLMYVMIGTTAVEYLVEVGGLGKMISVAYITFKVPAMYGHIFLIIAIVVVVVEILSKLEKRIRGWN